MSNGPILFGTDENRRKILAALRNPNYRWRTAAGIAKETNLDLGLVKEILHNWTDEVVIPPMRTVNGETIYGSRMHILSDSTMSNTISGAFGNRLY